MEKQQPFAKQQQSGKLAKIPVKRKHKITPAATQDGGKQSVNDTLPADASAEEDRNDAAPLEATAVSPFDYSVENHFRAMDTISELCREPEFELDQSEFQRLSSSITFIREWRQFCYKPRIVRFACRSETPKGNDVSGGIHLPQFSSAAVPKKDRPNGTNVAPELSKDFVMYVGGSVWAMDWCPNAPKISECDVRSEFIAVAAHPPDSSYHKIGTPLTGRGMIQIWCLLNVRVQEEDVPDQVKRKPKTNSRCAKSENLGTTQPKRPRGRPRKKPIVESVHNMAGNSENVQALGVQIPDDPLDSHEEVANGNTHPNQNNTEGVSAEEQQIPDAAECLNVKSSQPRKSRGRALKKPINEGVDNVDVSDQYVKPLAVQCPEDSRGTLLADGISLDKPEYLSNEDTCRDWNVREEGSAELEQNLRSTAAVNVRSSQTQKLEGRSRKKLIDKSADKFDHSNQCLLVPAVQLPGDAAKLLPAGEISTETHEEIIKIDRSRKRKGSDYGFSEDLVASKPPKMKDKGRTKYNFHNSALPHMTQDGDMSLVNPEASSNNGCDAVGSSENITHTGSVETNPPRCPIPDDVALPRVVLCLAHNGKVAWDVKWRPSDSYAKLKHRMGYLAVLLGNGALEVWDIPLPRATKIIYAACQKEGNDPRFVKLEPVFRCSMLKSGNRKSIPLTVEWSASAPHDLILAGCHDGVVALWKFSSTDPCKDTRPLLCFSADTAPIRALAWAPTVSDPESANVIVTAGHKGLKFWDIRDPFRPLWDLNPVQRVIYSLDWLPDPRCIILSFDDGTLRILSLSKAANDVPVTGKPFVGTQQQGLHSYYCSSFTIWSVQVSRLTGMVAYCSADGTVLRFQLTTRAVEKDPLRNRAPHFLCGSLTEEESAFTVVSSLLDTPFPMKKSLNEWANAPRTIRGFLSESNQEKRAKNELMAKQKNLEESTLEASYYGEETGIEFEQDDALRIPKSAQKPKAKSSSKKELESDQALICREGDQDSTLKEEESIKGERGNENAIEEFPPKTVAMHRVRWNMNKGSERWLCYGGAGGIVRCQEINLSCA